MIGTMSYFLWRKLCTLIKALFFRISVIDLTIFKCQWGTRAIFEWLNQLYHRLVWEWFQDWKIQKNSSPAGFPLCRNHCWWPEAFLFSWSPLRSILFPLWVAFLSFVVLSDGNLVFYFRVWLFFCQTCWYLYDPSGLNMDQPIERERGLLGLWVSFWSIKYSTFFCDSIRM